MKDKRIGNDINVAWAIMKKDGTPYSLAGKDITIYLKTRLEKEEVKDFSVEGNTISWTFYGKDQKHLGKHSLELVINENEVGMITTDKCGFVNLVSCSCHEGGSDEGNITTESIELTTTLEYVAGEGGGSYDDSAIWEAVTKLNEDKVDKVEGKQLSSNDYTDEEKEKLSNLENYDDTEIKEELTELSSKVGELEEGMVFEAVYGETTYDEIKVAVEGGKIVICRLSGSLCILGRIDNDTAYFYSFYGKNFVRLSSSKSAGWWNGTADITHELKTLANGNAQITIAGKSAEVATPQYVVSLLGTIINGEY